MKKSANYYCDKISNIIDRLYKYADETGIDVNHYAHQLSILRAEIYRKLNEQ